MQLEYLPLLQLQRGLYRQPRGTQRFRDYLRTMIGEEGQDLRLPPLVAMNPMAREHVPELLDAYLELGADAVAENAVAQAASELIDEPSQYQVGLVVSDDLKGGWTNRYAAEYGDCFGPRPRPSSLDSPRLHWLGALLWSSEPPSIAAVRESILLTAFRAAYVSRQGVARTLRERLAQEGWCRMRAGCQTPVYDAEEMEYTREVLAPHLDTEDMRTSIECLYGDTAGKTLGFTPRGLSHRAGLALALHDARLSAAHSGRRQLQPHH
ncbi:MAG: hypothetical protein ACKV0T_25775 [Planctomycetales bacterium]